MGEFERIGAVHNYRQMLERVVPYPDIDSVQQLVAMRALPPREELIAELDAVRKPAASLPPEPEHDLARIKLGRQVKDLEQKLALCRRKERIAASRPPGCWCLGAGGEGERGILPPGRVEDGAEPFETFARYCSCPEGREAERLANVAQHAHDRWAIDSRRKRIWCASRVPSIYDGQSLESWVEEVIARGGDREKATALVRSLRRWLDTMSWLLLIGPVSTGKTGLAIALIWELAGRGVTVHFVNASDMMMRIRGTFDRPEQSEVEMFDSLAQVPVLVVDDLGKQAMTPYAKELFYRLINARWGNGLVTIVTTNLEKTEQLKEHVGPAVYDRMIQVVKVAQVDPGVNLRTPRRTISALH